MSYLYQDGADGDRDTCNECGAKMAGDSDSSTFCDRCLKAAEGDILRDRAKDDALERDHE